MIERLSNVSDDNRTFLDGRYYEVVKPGGVGERVFVWARIRTICAQLAHFIYEFEVAPIDFKTGSASIGHGL